MASDQAGDPLIKSMVAARGRRAVVKTRFVNFRSSYPHGLILAVEGVDDKIVYSHWVTRVHPGLAFEFFLCNGKRIASQLAELLAEDLVEVDNNVIIIVDRDFDDLSSFVSTERVYMLDCYSFENYLVGEDVLNKTLEIAFPCHGEPGIRTGICELFRTDYEAFLKISAELNQRIFVGRRLGYNIDELIPGSLNVVANISLGNVTPTGANVAELIPLDPPPDPDVVIALHAEFQSFNARCRYRGKFALKFFSSWLGKLIEEYARSDLGLFGILSNSGAKVKHPELGLGGFASRSRVPVGLPEFIKDQVRVPEHNG